MRSAQIRWMLLTLTLGYLASFAFAQETAARGAEVLLYDGDLTLSPYGLRVGGWGDGECKENEDYFYEEAAGKRVLRVDVGGLYAGARIDLTKPFDIAPFLKNGYLVLRVRFPEGQGMGGMMGGGFGEFGAGGAFGPGGGAFGSGGFDGGASAPEGEPSAQEGGAMPGAPGMGGQGFFGGGIGGQETFIEHLRVVLYCEKGVLGVDRWKMPLEEADTDQYGFTSIAIPLQKFTVTYTDAQGERRSVPLPEFNAAQNPLGNLKRLLLFGDAEDTFWIAQIKFVVDNGPLTLAVTANGQPAPGAKMKVDEDIEFVAGVSTSIGDLRVVWDFGDTTPPLFGTAVKHKFVSADEFTITVTVIDLRRRKQPLTTKFKITAR